MPPEELQQSHSAVRKKIAIVAGILAAVLGLFFVWYWYAQQKSLPKDPQVLSPSEQILQQLEALKGDATITMSEEDIQNQLQSLSGEDSATPTDSADILNRLENLK